MVVLLMLNMTYGKTIVMRLILVLTLLLEQVLMLMNNVKCYLNVTSSKIILVNSVIVLNLLCMMFVMTGLLEVKILMILGNNVNFYLNVT